MTAIFNATGPMPATVPARGVAEPAPRAPAPPVGPAVQLPTTPPVVLVPVTRAGRPVGMFVAGAGGVRYRMLLDPDRLITATAGLLALGLLGAGVALRGRRRPPAVGALTMGPGGWVSFRGVPAPAPRTPRPRWARLLGARRLVVQR
ncbi:hypothetical protein [Micromonospora radicis]|uniref:Uncharacterized protein n=1 Tax=Micromonospora radicis TaxID=1894971 RepID=A0A418MUG5_9ACTN|nr:hypothetical protein [Micromonospora radicis]RIV37863.1 hypothetical protein D2L64_14170 [Micromonospora radicis]